MSNWKTSDALMSWLSNMKSSDARDTKVQPDWNDWLGEAKTPCDSIANTFAKTVQSRFEEARTLMRDTRTHKLVWLVAGPLSAAAIGRLSLSSSLPPLLGTVFAATSNSSTRTAIGYVAQLGSSILMMMSIKGLGSHATSKRGNIYGIAGVTTAVLSIMLTSWIGPTGAIANQLFSFLPVAVVGQFIGVYVARSVQMDQMPELVAGFHSLTGLAAVLVGIAAQLGHGDEMSIANMVETFIGVSVGAATFSGSIAAALKLNGKISGGPIGLSSRFAINTASGIKLALLLAGYIVTADPTGRVAALCGNTAVSLVLGTMLVLPIGGADIPIVISILNSLSGLATSATGFGMDNSMLVMTGALIASSGAILSETMCKGINRSLGSVLMGGFGVDGGVAVAPASAAAPAQEIFPISVPQLIGILQNAKKVLIIPGYGMAVARCQSGVYEIFSELQKRGIEVVFGIHPVAGRLPGHMNVILSEADVPYDVVKEMDEVNAEIESFDVAIVLGANDIVNPATASDPSSPIFGMPAIECWRVPKVVVMKRGMNTGYSGVDNPLFYLPNTNMLFGDAKDTVEGIHAEIGKSENSEWPNFGRKIGHDSTPSSELAVFLKPDLTRLPATVRKLGALANSGSDKDNRIPLSPKVVLKFRQAGFEVLVPSGLGTVCGWSDEDFSVHGARIVPNDKVIMEQCDLILKVSPLDDVQLKHTRPPEQGHEDQRQILVTSFPVSEAMVDTLLPPLTARRMTTFNLNLVPRISRAQSMDILSSMANLAGYKAVINAFAKIGKLSRSSVTAGGNIPAARVFVIGCGVSGLSAIATAHALGATVLATDVRPATKEQVESIGAQFVAVEDLGEVNENGGYAGEVSASFADRQRQLYEKYTSSSDIVITTAMVPGKPAPKLISAQMVKGMKPGSIVVDLAAPSGGNCELTKVDVVFTDEDSHVIIDGTANYASELAQLASELFSQNCFAFIDNLCAGKKDASNLKIDTEDVIVRQSLVVLDDQVMYPPPPLLRAAETAVKPTLLIKPISVNKALKNPNDDAILIAGAIALATLGMSTDHQTARLVGDFLLSAMIGHYTVSSVTPALHTPLISVTNAISGIIVVGGMLEIDGNPASPKSICALAAVLASVVNVSGGFAVTDRMLSMFRSQTSVEE
jgi:NAD(P) transhydrogenase